MGIQDDNSLGNGSDGWVKFILFDQHLSNGGTMWRIMLGHLPMQRNFRGSIWLIRTRHLVHIYTYYSCNGSQLEHHMLWNK